MKDLGKVKGVVIHCSATTSTMDIGYTEIRQWHVVENHWSDVAYHFIIRRNGEIETGRPINKQGAHARGHNKGTVAICVVGGTSSHDVDGDGFKDPENNFTVKQFQALRELLNGIKIQFGFKWIKGHNELEGVTKPCPCFPVQDFVKDLGLA